MSFINFVKEGKVPTPSKKQIIESYEQFINELKFSEKNIEKAVQLYSKIMGRRMGGIFKPFGFEDYKRAMGPGRGYRMMNDKGEQLRFNWDEKLAKQAAYELTSIDYWSSDNTDFQKPSRTIKFAPELNVIQVLDKVTDALLTGTINEAEEIIDSLNLMVEARTAKEKQDWLVANGMPKSLAGSVKGMKDRAEALGLSEQLEVFLGKSESNSFEDGLKEADKKLSKQVFADPETVFEDIEDLLSLVANGKWRTLIVCGMGGIGKCLQGEQTINVKGL